MSLQLQDDGVHHYTTIDVAQGVTLTFLHNSKNTPVCLLATGDVNILGIINIAGLTGRVGASPQAGLPGSEALGGPGGFPGGIGGIAVFNGGTGIGTSGGGPGGGAASLDSSPVGNIGRAGNGGSHFTAGVIGSGNAEPTAPTYGDARLLTVSGGSGGGGGNVHITSASTTDGPGGGGGGILIASSTQITINGSINANGGSGHGASGFAGGGYAGSGGGAGGGAGGTIRLMSNTVGGTGNMTANGGGGFSGGLGRIRVEAFNVSGTLVQNSSPPPASSTPTIVKFDPGSIPTIQITAIGGQSVSQPPSGSTTSPDVTIPAATSNPVEITIATTNVPDGAVIKLRIVLENGAIVTADSEPVANNATTASVDLSTGVGVIYATADFEP